MTLVQPTYFAPIDQYVVLLKCNNVVFEFEDNYQKQTYRNRCYINTAQGKHSMNIPILHDKKKKQKTREVKIDTRYPWNTIQLKTLKTAYSASPFFEFYKDDLQAILKKNYNYLIDLNMACHSFVMNALQLDSNFTKSTNYEAVFTGNDYRFLANAKREPLVSLERYFQVFESENGFQRNLSILDLLFMEGPSAAIYLERQILPT